MKTKDHISFSFIWTNILILMFGWYLSVYELFFLIISCNLPDFDLLDYIFLSILKFVFRNNDFYLYISQKKYEKNRKIILNILINTLGLIIFVLTKNIYILGLFIFISGFVFLEHRRFTHSILAYIIFSVIAWISLYQYSIKLIIIVSMGYLMHIIQDLFTYDGVELLYPKRKKYSLAKYFIKSANENKKVRNKLLHLSLILFIFILFLLKLLKAP